MPGLSIDVPLDEPYFTGGSQSSDVPGSLMCAIAGHGYMFDVRKYSRRTLPGVATQQVVSGKSGEADLSREGFWRRSQSRFGLGAAQLYFDDDNASERRFFSSKGVNIWDDRSLTLHHDTEQKKSSAQTNLRCFTVGGYLYFVDGVNLRFTSDPTPTTPTFTTVTYANPITSIATDGVSVFVAFGALAVPQKLAVGSAVTAAFGVLNPTLLAFANGRLLGATDNALYEIDATGAKPGGVNIRLDPRGSTAQWVAITGSPSAIFAALNVGGTSELYSIAAADQTTALTAVVWAGGLPAGETVNTLSFYGGIVIIATSIGIRVATISSRTLTYGEAIVIPGGVKCLEPQAEFCWFGWSNFDGTSTGLGRANLATNTSQDTIVPGYASDLMATVQGVVQGVCSFGTRRYFAVSGQGLYGETATLVPSGTINSGWIRFSTLATKVFSGVLLGFDSLLGSIGAVMNFEDGTARSIGIASTQGTFMSSLLDASGSGIAAQLVLTLTRATTTTGPTLRYWVFNALPRPARVVEILVPIRLAAKVANLHDRDESYDPLAEYQYLDGLRSSNRLIAFQEGSVLTEARVDALAIDQGGADHWDDPHPRGGETPSRWFGAFTLLVRLLTKEN